MNDRFPEAVGSVLARDPLAAPGLPADQSEKDRAITLARAVLSRSNHADDPACLLARQLLRALGLSERG